MEALQIHTNTIPNDGINELDFQVEKQYYLIIIYEHEIYVVRETPTSKEGRS